MSEKTFSPSTKVLEPLELTETEEAESAQSKDSADDEPYADEDDASEELHGGDRPVLVIGSGTPKKSPRRKVTKKKRVRKKKGAEQPRSKTLRSPEDSSKASKGRPTQSLRGATKPRRASVGSKDDDSSDEVKAGGSPRLKKGSKLNEEGYIWNEGQDLAYTLVLGKAGEMALVVRVGSLHAIVEQFIQWLVKPPGSSSSSEAAVHEQLKYFLCAHERVISTPKLLGRLGDIHRHAGVHSEALSRDAEMCREGVWRFINFWLDASYYPDFVGYDGTNTKSMAALHHFILSTFSGDDMPKRKELLARITSTLPWLRSPVAGDMTPPGSKGPRRGSVSKRKPKKELPADIRDLCLLDFSDEEAAQAITRIDAKLFRKIKRADLLYKDFENLKRDMPHSYYVMYAQRLKKFSFWVASLLVQEDKRKLRVRLYKRLQNIARILQVDHRNLSSSSAILSGMTRLAVTRMRETMKEIPQDCKDLVKEMQEDLMGFSDNWARGVISEAIAAKVACIPTIDIMRKDVLRIDEGSKGDTDHRRLLKFFKVVSFGKAIHFIEQSYSVPYHFETPHLDERQEKIREFFSVLPNTLKDSDLLMRKSFQLEKASNTEMNSKIYRKYLDVDPSNNK